jgi:ubiquinone/menaquinone biosynthesis C-methylase UbiE
MGRPAIYHAIDVQPDFFPPLREKALGLSIPIQCHTVTSNRPHIPLDSESQDFMMSFYSLEHLNPLHAWLDEIFRILKPNGILVGAIPAEGGIGWGLGRWLTSRRVLKRKYHLDMNKIICWEHVSFCDEILRELNRRGSLWKQNWPLPFFPNDFSLVVKFRVVKPFDS